jgi:hypothetical protein
MEKFIENNKIWTSLKKVELTEMKVKQAVMAGLFYYAFNRS